MFRLREKLRIKLRGLQVHGYGYVVMKRVQQTGDDGAVVTTAIVIGPSPNQNPNQNSAPGPT